MIPSGEAFVYFYTSFGVKWVFFFLSGDTCCSREDCCEPTANINKDEAAVMSQLAHSTTTAVAVPKMISHIYPKNDCGTLKLL